MPKSAKDILDQELVAELRQLASQGNPTCDLVRRVQDRHSFPSDSFLVPIIYLTKTFGIGINAASEICHGGQNLPATTLQQPEQTIVTKSEQPSV